MKIKHFMLIVILVIIAIIVTLILFKHRNTDRADVKVPILLYHDFVTIVPDNDPDDFNYINTSKSFEENIRVLLENGYTFISFQELNDAYNEKIDLPEKPILISMDDGYASNYEYIYPILKNII